MGNMLENLCDISWAFIYQYLAVMSTNVLNPSFPPDIAKCSLIVPLLQQVIFVFYKSKFFTQILRKFLRPYCILYKKG